MKSKMSWLRLLAAAMLVITMTLSLTSCVFDLGFFFEGDFPFIDGGDDNGGNNGEDNGEGDQQTPTPPDNGQGGDIPNSDNYGDFYPGSGQGSTEGISELTKTLLCTVDIVVEADGAAGAGSGVIYKLDKEKGDAYIITNYHVLYLDGIAKKINVYLYGMESSAYAIPATMVGGSLTYDIAVIKITGSEVLKNSYATAATIGRSDDVRTFDKVYAVGNAEGGGISATEGIVSVESQNVDINGADNSILSLRVIRIDTPVNHGNSGGGLYDERGRLVGIVSAKEVGDDVDNIGYAIPSDLAIKLANNILDNCNGTTSVSIKKALMGVTISSYVSGLEMDGEGGVYQVKMVEVIEVSAGSLAQGKVQVGDVIDSISVDGVITKVTQLHHVTDAMLDARLGSKVVMNITRGGKQMSISFTITEGAITTVK